jgi:hypothetical protein
MVAILVVISLPRLVRAQPGAGEVPVILLHPGVATVFQLPDAIAHARILDRDEIRFAAVGNELFVRPRPGTPAGMTALLEVETRTARWTFQLVVVARARDARQDVRVSPVDAAAIEESPPESPPAVPARPETPRPVTVSEAAEPGTNAPTPAPSPAPAAGLETAEASTESNTANMERDATPAGRSRFDLAAHVGAGLGFTGAKVSGYRAETALRPHYSLNLRLTAEPRNALWSLQAGVSGEWLGGPMVYRRQSAKLEVNGPRLRLEAGARASLGTTWKASVHAELGIQVHLRRTAESPNTLETTATLEQSVVLAWGMGLSYLGSRVLLGLDFLVRHGGADDYHSVEALLTVGRFLDQGD